MTISYSALQTITASIAREYLQRAYREGDGRRHESPIVILSYWDKWDGDDVTVDFERVLIPGECVLMMENWGYEMQSDYVSEVLKDVTLRDLIVEAEAGIRFTRDFHHVFLEGFRPHGNVSLNGNTYPVYEISMGS